MKSNWTYLCSFTLSFLFGGSISAVAAPSMIEAVDTIQSEAPVSPTLTPTPSPTPVNNSTKINSIHIPNGRARPIASYGSNIPGNFSGGGLFDMSGVLSGSPALGILNLGSDQNRFSVDLYSHREIWRKAPTDADECQLNMTSSVKRVGPFVVVGWPSYSNQFGGNVNGLGKVCVYDAATGDFINSTVGWNQGELFGSKVEEIKDTQRPNRYLIAVSAPNRWSTQLGLPVGGVDVFDIQDIVSQGFWARPLTSIEGGRRPDGCSNSELGAAIANAGDLNADGLDDLVITDPNYRCSSGTSFGYRGRLYIFDSRVDTNGQYIYSYRAQSDLYYNVGTNLVRFGHSLTTIKTATDTVAVVSGLAATYTPFAQQGTPGIFRIQRNGITGIRNLGRLSTSVLASSRPGWTLVNVGDVNGDGFADIASGNPAPGSINSRIEFFSGRDILGANNSAIAPFSEFYTQTNALLGYGTDSILGIPDMDGDGKNEVAIGGMAESTVYIVKP